VEVSNTFAHGPSGCAAAWENLGVSAQSQDWFNNGETNYGFRVQIPNESTSGAYKRFKSASAGSTTAPRLVVTYDRLPPTPPLRHPRPGTG